ncbi:Vegetative incompatibility HET-E-1-like protein [Cladobotryum mycophilum]|uniref:Vegetative incompatibility HET-E-1-like protein n=1 Tax=Cladobotryum mycophilum TaxID=491253 RepID=A0ABR0T188_9HYPO
MREFVTEWTSGGDRQNNNLPKSVDPNQNAKLLKEKIKRMWNLFPHATLAWAGLCSASLILLNPISMAEEACDGIVRLASKMLGYMGLPRLLMKYQNDPVINEDELKKGITNLYESILLFEMRILISYEDTKFDQISESISAIIDAEKGLYIYEDMEKELNQVVVSSKVKKSHTASRDFSGEEWALLQQLGDALYEGHIIPDSWDSKSMSDLYDWAASETAYDDWLNWQKAEVHNRLLWIQGKAGRGKTKLSSAIIQTLQNTFQREVVVQELWRVAAYLCGNEHGAVHVVKSLIHQLIVQQPPLIKHLEQKYTSTGRKHFKYPNDFLAISGIFYDLITDESFLKAYLIIDGIDECLTTNGWAGTTDLLKLIKTSAEITPNVRWLISTSSSDDAKGKVSQEITKCLHLDLDINDTGIQSDKGVQSILPTYISYEVSKVARQRKYDDDLHEKIRSQMKKNALPSNNFLWVSMVCRILAAEENWYALRRLNELPEELEELYHFIGKELKTLPRDDGKYCRSVLWAMSTSQWSLHVSELAVLSGLHSGIDTDGDGAVDAVVDTETIVNKCFAFLKIDGKHVHFLNSQVKEYSQRAITLGVDLPPDHDHTLLAERCLQALTNFFIHSYKQTDSIQYSLTNWIYHVLKPESPPLTILEAVRIFLEKYLPGWLEQVVKMPYFQTTVGLLRKLDLKVRTSPGIPSNVIDIIEDAHRLFRLYESFDIPLHVHSHNTLLFCPTQSPTRQSHLASSFPYLLQAPVTEERWASNFLTLGGHTGWIQSMACSPSGLFIASGSDDKTVRIWDAETGAIQHTMKGHGDYVRSVAISSTGMIASGSEDGTTTLWESNTGKVFTTFNNFGGFVRGLSFSPDGNRLAVVAAETLTVINLSNNARVKGVGHEETISCVTFSADGRMIATGSWDATVKIWDASIENLDEDLTNLTVTKTFSEHADSINSVRFTPDSKTLATSSEDGVTKLWDTRTWESLVLKHQGAVIGSAFFPDGSQFVSSTDQNTINIWDTKTGQRKAQIKCSGSAAKSVAIPSSGQYIVSSGRDCLLRFWYAHQRVSQDDSDPNKEANSPTSAITISRNGAYIASGLKSGEICLWDGNSGQRIQTSHTLKHGSKVNRLAFSPNGQKLASASHDGKVRLWDVMSGNSLKIFQGHSDWVRYVAFSADGKFIASASDDYTVGIWQVDGGQEEAVEFLRGHRDYCRCVAYSPDDKYIVSSGMDNEIIVWKTETRKRFKSIKLTGNVVVSVAVTPDSLRILSSQSDGTLKVWDLDTGLCSLSFMTGHHNGFNKLFFESQNQQYVMTELGPIYIGQDAATKSPPPTTPRLPYALKFEKSDQLWWITYLGRDIIYLPKEYQPADTYTTAVLGHRVVIGCKSGRVFCGTD